MFTKYNKDLSYVNLKSDDLINALTPITKQCKNTINLLTDSPSFAYKKLNLTSKNVFPIFGYLTKDVFILDEFMKNSNSKNPKYFLNITIIAISKDSMWFIKDKAYNIDDEFYKQSVEVLNEMESLGYKRFESEYFYIYVKDC